MKYDTTTGKPIGDEEAENFDPMTGEPIYVQPQPTGYDPMTGEPIYVQSQPTGYDPMTGEPVYGQPENEKSGIRNKLKFNAASKLAIVAAAVLIILLVAAAGIKSGLFLSKQGKVMLAVVNTVSEMPQIIEDLSIQDALSGDKYTIGAGMSYGGEDFIAEYKSAKSKKQLSLSASSLGAEAYLTLDKKALEIAVPEVYDGVITYYYTKDNDGLLADALGEENIELINTVLSSIFSQEVEDEDTQSVAADIIKELKSIEFSSISKEKLTVDEKERSCKGYLMVIDTDTIANILDICIDYAEEKFPYQLQRELGLLSLINDADYLERTVDRMDDIEIKFYIYRNKLACISTEIEGDETRLSFLGGDYRMQNMELEIEGNKVLEVKGKTSGPTETIKVKADGELVLKSEYDSESGDFEITVDNVSFDGNIEKTSKALKVEIDNIGGADLNLYVLRSAAFDSYDRDNIVDIGNADESDLEELSEDMDINLLNRLARMF